VGWQAPGTEKIQELTPYLTTNVLNRVRFPASRLDRYGPVGNMARAFTGRERVTIDNAPCPRPPKRT